MIPMLDMRAERILELQNQTGLELLQLRTPLTRYASRNHLHYGVDNGAYSGFQERKFLSLVDECVEDSICMWINLPDALDQPGQPQLCFMNTASILDLMFRIDATQSRMALLPK